MCCESCPKYDACEEEQDLKDTCCPRCPDYYDCVGMNEEDDKTYGDSSADEGNIGDSL